MKHIFSSLFGAALMLLLLTASSPVKPQGDGEKKLALYAVAFYNQENLFDTLHDAGKNDWEYLPDGAMHWNKRKYEAKLKNMSEVLALLGTDKLPKVGATVIGLSEVENRAVLEDLLKQPALKDRGYQIVHIEGPDRRGVDCAFFYNPKFFRLESYELHPYYTEDNDTTYRTRGFLRMTGRMAGERVHCVVCHWPSRGATSPARERAGVLVKQLKDSLLAADPASKVMVMGDLNDDPGDKSIVQCLGAKSKEKDCGPKDFYNPAYNMLYKVGQGTLLYDGKWNLFDQIIISGNLLGKDRSTLKFYGYNVFMRDFLFNQDGADKGAPKRTHSRGVWLNGYSDHLPVVSYYIKEIK